MARLILMAITFFVTIANAFETEVEIVFPYRDIKSGIVIGVDDTAEHMLYPVHTYSKTEKNEVGYFRKPRTELSKYLERSLPSIKKDLYDKDYNFVAPHSYAVKVNGQFLKPESKFFKDLIIKVEAQASDKTWKGIKYESYSYNKKTKQITRHTYENGKRTSTTKQRLARLCTPTSSEYFFCETGYGTLKIKP